MWYFSWEMLLCGNYFRWAMPLCGTLAGECRCVIRYVLAGKYCSAVFCALAEEIPLCGALCFS